MNETAFNNLKPSGCLRVFLCHSTGDKSAVRQLYHRLKDNGFQPWLDEEDLLPGDDWAREIPKAVRNSDIVLVCLSRGSINKDGFVQKEIKFALDKADEKPEGARYIIPVKLEDCEVPERINRWQWVDLFEEKGYERLVHTLRNHAGHSLEIRPPNFRLQANQALDAELQEKAIEFQPSTTHSQNRTSSTSFVEQITELEGLITEAGVKSSADAPLSEMKAFKRGSPARVASRLGLILGGDHQITGQVSPATASPQSQWREHLAALFTTKWKTLGRQRILVSMIGAIALTIALVGIWIYRSVVATPSTAAGDQRNNANTSIPGCSVLVGIDTLPRGTYLQVKGMGELQAPHVCRQLSQIGLNALIVAGLSFARQDERTILVGPVLINDWIDVSRQILGLGLQVVGKRVDGDEPKIIDFDITVPKPLPNARAEEHSSPNGTSPIIEAVPLIKVESPWSEMNAGSLGITKRNDQITSRRAITYSLIRSIAHRGALSKIAISPSGRLVASTFLDSATSLWELTSGRELMMLPDKGARALSFSPDSTMLVTHSERSGIEITDVASGLLLERLRPTPSIVDIALSPNGTRLASVGSEGLYIWNISTRDGIYINSSLPASNVRWSINGRYLITGGDSRGDSVSMIGLWDNELRAVKQLQGASMVALSASGLLLATGEGPKLTIREMLTGANIAEDNSLKAPIGGLAFSPDGEILAVASGPEIRLYGAADWAWFQTIHPTDKIKQLHGDVRFTAIAFSADHRWLVVSGENWPRLSVYRADDVDDQHVAKSSR